MVLGSLCFFTTLFPFCGSTDELMAPNRLFFLKRSNPRKTPKTLEKKRGKEPITEERIYRHRLEARKTFQVMGPLPLTANGRGSKRQRQ